MSRPIFLIFQKLKKGSWKLPWKQTFLFPDKSSIANFAGIVNSFFSVEKSVFAILVPAFWLFEAGGKRYILICVYISKLFSFRQLFLSVLRFIVRARTRAHKTKKDAPKRNPSSFFVVPVFLFFRCRLYRQEICSKKITPLFYSAGF